MKLNFFTFLGLVAGSGCGPRLNMIEKREYKQIYETGKYFDASKPETDFNAIYQKNLLLGKWRTIFTLLASNNDSIQYEDGDVTIADKRAPECATVSDNKARSYCQVLNLSRHGKQKPTNCLVTISIVNFFLSSN